MPFCCDYACLPHVAYAGTCERRTKKSWNSYTDRNCMAYVTKDAKNLKLCIKGAQQLLLSSCVTVVASPSQRPCLVAWGVALMQLFSLTSHSPILTFDRGALRPVLRTQTLGAPAPVPTSNWLERIRRTWDCDRGAAKSPLASHTFLNTAASRTRDSGRPNGMRRDVRWRAKASGFFGS